MISILLSIVFKFSLSIKVKWFWTKLSKSLLVSFTFISISGFLVCHFLKSPVIAKNSWSKDVSSLFIWIDSLTFKSARTCVFLKPLKFSISCLRFILSWSLIRLILISPSKTAFAAEYLLIASTIYWYSLLNHCSDNSIDLWTSIYIKEAKFFKIKFCICSEVFS